MRKLCTVLVVFSLVWGVLQIVTVKAADPVYNFSGILSFVPGTGFFDKSHGVATSMNNNQLSLVFNYMGTAKEAAYAEIPVAEVGGPGLELHSSINNGAAGLKVTSSDKSVKVKYDKANGKIVLTSSSLGSGIISVSGVVKDGKESTTYIATLPFMVRPAVATRTDVGYKAKGAKEVSWTEGQDNLDLAMQVGESIPLQVRFFNAPLGVFYTYGGARNNGIWQSETPSFLQVSNDGKLRALNPTTSGEPARATFIDYLGRRTTTVTVSISPKANPKLDDWDNSIRIEVKPLGVKGAVSQFMEKGGTLSWNMDQGSFQLIAWVRDTKKEMYVKANVYIYIATAGDPEYAVVDNKGIVTPLKANSAAGVSIILHVVARDSLGPKHSFALPLTIHP